MAYDDSEVRQQFPVCFTARITGVELRTSSESKEAAFVDPNRLNGLNIHPGRAEPYVG